MYEKTKGIFENLAVADVCDGYTVRYDGIKTYYYELLYNVDNDWINDDMVAAFIEEIGTKSAQFSTNYVFNLLVFGFDDSATFKRLLTKDAKSEVVNQFLEVKRDFIKPYKTIRVVFTVTLIGEDKDESVSLGDLKVRPMSAIEIYNVLFNILNPPLYRDDFKAAPLNYAELANPSISIPMTLTKTPIFEYDDRLTFDNLNCAQYFMSAPPSTLQKEFSLSFALNKLCSLESNFIMSIIMSNDKGDANVSTKGIATSAIMTALNSMNLTIARAMEDYTENIRQKGLKSVTMSLQIALFNENFERLKKDGKEIKVLDGFEGSVMSPTVFAKYEDYLAMIPSVVQRFKYSFSVSSEQFASVLMFPQYNFDSATLFEKKGRILTSFDILEFKSTNKPGALIFAPPGSGKSALLNNLYFNMLWQQDKIESLIIDFGGSYLSLYNMLNMPNMLYTDMDFGSGEKKYYNPFDLQFGKPCDEQTISVKIPILLMFLRIALKLDNESLDNLIKKGSELLYKSYISGRNKIKVDRRYFDKDLSDYYIDRYVDSGYTDFESFSKAMPTIRDFVKFLFTDENLKDSFDASKIKDLADKLTEFSEGAPIFTDNSTEYLMENHLIVDLKKIALNDPSMLNLMLAYIINSKLMVYMNAPEEEKGHPKVIMIDEYAQFKERSKFVDEIAKTIFKTGRKEFIHLFLITQNINDFVKDFFNTSGRMISFSPTSIGELNTISEITGETVENLKPLMTNIGTVHGQYSEFLVFNSDEKRTKNFYRSKVSKYEYYAFITTSADDRQRKAELVKENGGNWKEAILQMVRENEKK